MSEWREFKLKDLCEKVTVGYVGPMAEQYLDEGVTFLRSLNIKPFRIELNDVKFVSEQFHHQIRKSALRPGDVAVVRTGYPGTAAVIPNTLPVSNCSDLVIVRPGKELNPHFITAIFNSAFGQTLVSGNTVGAAQQHFNITVAKELRFRVPPKPVQDKIAAVLSAYDELIEVNRRRIGLLEKLAEELYREWFVRLRFPGHEKTKIVKGVPQGWSIEPLGSLVSDIIDYRGITPEKLGTQWSNEGITALSALNVKNGRLIKLEDTYKASETLYERWMRKELQMHDILLTSEAPLGQVYMLMDSEKYVLSQRLFALRANRARIEPCYLYHYLLGPVGQGQLAARATGSTVGGIRQQLLRQIEVIVPHPDLQENYRNVMMPVLDQIHALTKASATLTRTRDILLPRLISGKLRVEDLDIQFLPGMETT